MKNLFVSLIVLFACFQANAQTKQQKIAELISLVSPEKNTDKMFANMLQMMKQQHEKDLTPVQRDSLFNYEDKQFKEIIKKITTQYLPRIYDKYFSENEIDDLLRFYKSPAGQKYVKAAPDIQKELLQSANQDFMDLKKRIENKKKEIQATK